MLVGTPRSDADVLADLNNAFKDAYGAAAGRTLSDLRSSVPVLVNRFGQIALYRPGVDKPDVFSMDMKAYLEARAVAHTPVALYAGLSPFGALDAERLNWLAAYQKLLAAAEAEVKERADIPTDIRTSQIELLAAVRGFAQRMQQQANVDKAILDEMGLTVRAGVSRSIAFAAASQVEQFRKQVEQWKANYSSLPWDRAVVVIIGVHQARDKYLQRQFFDWMTRDTPNKQDHVVFAETLAPPAPLDKQAPTEALVLLSKVMFDKGLANTVFGGPYVLQSDVLGGAAEEIIGTWQ